MKKKAARVLGLLLCMLVLVGSAPARYTAVSFPYAAETVLYGEAVCPSLLLGSEDGSLIIRWASWNSRPVVVHYGPDDGSGTLGEDHQTVMADSVRSSAFGGCNLRGVELQLPPGEYLYSLTEEGEEPGVLYPIHWRCGESFRVVMSSDSHLYNDRETALYEAAMAAGAGEQGADLIIHGGDMNDNAQATPLVLSSNAPHTRSVPTLAVVGNHDMLGLIYGFFTPPHLDKKTGDFWTVQNNILFVGVNIHNRDMTAHQRYLNEVIPANREGCDWVVMLIHYSMMSNGQHGKDQPVYNFRVGLRDLIAEQDVDLVLSGHDHEYDRSYLIGAEDMVEGSGGESVVKHPGETLYISLPTAVGNKLYSQGREPLYPLAVEAPQSERGYVTADFTKDSITIDAWSSDTGEHWDHLILTRAES